MSQIEIQYNKLLVARHDPKNKCFADDEAVLVLKPKKLNVTSGHSSHFFLDRSDLKTKSKYGWVKIIEPITFNEFVNKYLGETDDRTMIEHNKVMLDSIQKLDANVPVAVTYSERGVEKKEMVLTVHRVFFY